MSDDSRAVILSKDRSCFHLASIASTPRQLQLMPRSSTWCEVDEKLKTPDQIPQRIL